MSTFNRMLDAAKIRVCSVVNTDVADCLLVAIPPCCQDWLRMKNCQGAIAAFSYRSEVDPLLRRGLSVQMARSIGDKGVGTTSLCGKPLTGCSLNSRRVGSLDMLRAQSSGKLNLRPGCREIGEKS